MNNDTRRVMGPVNVECGTGKEWMHSAPYGNWGVDSTYDRKWDGWQFAGWKDEDGWRQWNSCTGQWWGEDDLPDGPTQIADPDGRNIYATRTRKHGRKNVPCRDIFGSALYVIGNSYMKLYELDLGADRILGGNGSDHVTTLYFPGVSIPMTCTSAEYCHGESRWLSSRSNSVARARIKAHVTTSYR